MTHQLDTNKSNDSTHAQDVSKDARVFDVEKMAEECGGEYINCHLYYMSPSNLSKFASLVLEEAAKRVESITPSEPNCVWEAAYKHVAEEHADAIRALAKEIK